MSEIIIKNLMTRIGQYAILIGELRSTIRFHQEDPEECVERIIKILDKFEGVKSDKTDETKPTPKMA